MATLDDEALQSQGSFEERIMAKFRSKIDICMGDWDEPGVINTEMAAHKIACTEYMSKEEIKEYPYGPVTLCVPPTMFDLSKAKRVKTTKEMLDKIEAEKEAQREAAKI